MASEGSLHPKTRSSVYDLGQKDRQQNKQSTAAKSTLTEEIDFGQRSGLRVGADLRILKRHHPDPVPIRLLPVAVRRIRGANLLVFTGAETNRPVDLFRIMMMMMMIRFRLLKVSGGDLMVLWGWRRRRRRMGCFLVEDVHVLLHGNGGCDRLKALRPRPCSDAESSRRVLRVVLPRRRRFLTVDCRLVMVRTVPCGSVMLRLVLIAVAVPWKAPWSDE